MSQSSDRVGRRLIRLFSQIVLLLWFCGLRGNPAGFSPPLSPDHDPADRLRPPHAPPRSLGLQHLSLLDHVELRRSLFPSLCLWVCSPVGGALPAAPLMFVVFPLHRSASWEKAVWPQPSTSCLSSTSSSLWVFYLHQRVRNKELLKENAPPGGALQSHTH